MRQWYWLKQINARLIILFDMLKSILDGLGLVKLCCKKLSQLIVNQLTKEVR